MKKTFICLILFFIFSLNALNSKEILNRGLIALQNDKNSVYIGWRLFFDDPKDVNFKLIKTVEGGTNQEKLIADGFLTNFIDNNVNANDVIIYRLKTFSNNSQIGKEEIYKIKIEKESKPYIEIPLAGNYTFQQVTVADLDNDNELEYIIKEPNFNVDPYQHEGYWKKSETTYKIEAYKLNGKLLWSYDMGWSIEEGILVFSMDRV